MSKHETEADMAATQAEYQRRREEWQHELRAAGQGEGADREAHRRDAAQARDQLGRAAPPRPRGGQLARRWQTYLRDKYTNEQLYGWMLGQLSGVYFQAYKVAFDAAQQAERAFRFERGDHVLVVHRVLVLGQPQEGTVRRRAAAARSAAHGGGARRRRSPRAGGHAAHLAARGLPDRA